MMDRQRKPDMTSSDCIIKYLQNMVALECYKVIFTKNYYIKVLK